MEQKERLKGKQLRCSKCDKVVGVVNGNEIDIIKGSKLNPQHTKIVIEHDNGGSFKISCECCNNSYFATTQKTLSMRYEIVPKKEKEDSVDKSI